MKIIPSITLRIGEPDALYYSPPGRIVDLESDEADRLVKGGVAKYVDVRDDTDHFESIVDAIGDLDEGDFGKDGKPSVRAIEDILDRNVSAADRDAAWIEFKRHSDDD